MTRSHAIAFVPKYQNKTLTITEDQDVWDIVQEVCAAHKYFAADYLNLAEQFYTGNTYTTCKKLYNFCRDNITYQIEGDGFQTTKSPGAILYHGYGDCKHYAGFIAGVLNAINDVFDAKIKWRYRFAGYEPFSTVVGHVFVVAWDDAGEIWIDPVLSHFDERKQPYYFTDKKVTMSLKRLSGLDGNNGQMISGLGLIDDVAGGASDIISLFKGLGFGDQVPNYPIKSGNTFNKLKGIVASKVPLPVNTIAEAQSRLAMAQAAQREEQAGDGGAANQTIIMMYQELIDGLKRAIANAQLTGGGVDYSYTPNATGTPTTGNPTYTPAPAPQTAGMGGTLPLILIGGAAVFFLANKKRSIHGTKGNNTMLFVGLGALAFFYFKQKAAQKKEDENLATGAEITQADIANYNAAQERDPYTGQLPASAGAEGNGDQFIDEYEQQFGKPMYFTPDTVENSNYIR